MENTSIRSKLRKRKLSRCEEWLQDQKTEEPKRLLLQHKNHSDIEFIMETNSVRRRFKLSNCDEMSIPAAIDEDDLTPCNVARNKLTSTDLRLECEWHSCRFVIDDYEVFQKHVKMHASDMQVIKTDNKVNYVCLWDICGYKTEFKAEMVRHIYYHSYHSKLMASGYNARASLDLMSCNKDSGKRNQIPVFKSDFKCLWFECDLSFVSVQDFFNHIKVHIYYADNFMCSWAGCGTKFSRKSPLSTHVRSHTGERQIACSHCGLHFASNRKLADHTRRQNAPEDGGFRCSVCSRVWATEYLLREHARQHVSVYACTYCDMSAPNLGVLAMHVRYRHLSEHDQLRQYKCPKCTYKAITKWDMKKHIKIHEKKSKLKQETDLSDEENSEGTRKKTSRKSDKKYSCHMCPEGKSKIFSRGTRLTSHLTKVHGIRWPFGHCRFRYQISDDGMYRLTTTRYESLEVSKKIQEGSNCPKNPITKVYNIQIIAKSEATEDTPKLLEIKLVTDEPDDPVNPKVKSNNTGSLSVRKDIFGTLKTSEKDSLETVKTVDKDTEDGLIADKINVKFDIESVSADVNIVKQEYNEQNGSGIEIEMCQADEHGNIISSKVLNSNDFVLGL